MLVYLTVTLPLINIPGIGGHRGRDLMVVGFTIAYAISAYHH